MPRSDREMSWNSTAAPSDTNGHASYPAQQESSQAYSAPRLLSAYSANQVMPMCYTRREADDGDSIREPTVLVAPDGHSESAAATRSRHGYFYNQHRPHTATGKLPPNTRLDNLPEHYSKKCIARETGHQTVARCPSMLNS